MILRPGFHQALALVGLVVLTGCAEPAQPSHEHHDDPHEHVGTVAQGVWVNGDFENSAIGANPDGWTVAANLNPGITDLRPNPQTFASLNLATGGTLMTKVVGGAPESQLDPDLGTKGTLRFPKYGQRAVRVNYLDSSSSGIGKNRNANVLRQTMTVGLGDVDPTDNKVHVRFAVAPVLENPGHAYYEQPYYFVRLQNLTKNQTVYQDFNASGQPGVPWKNFTTPANTAASYTDWQLVDIAPGDAKLSIGDQIEMTVVAAGCSASGHWGRVYVDAVGSGIPGLFTWATGPQLANAGSVIKYTVYYKNGGTTTTSGTQLEFNTPPNTTFHSVSLGSACTRPAVGSAGAVTCPVGSLAPGGTGSFDVSVTVNASTPNGTVITNGNYAISADGVTPLIGPKVQTTVTSNQTYANIGISMSDGVAAVGWGQPIRYDVVVHNAGPSAATVRVTDTMPAQLTGVSWTCSGTGGGTCTASGTGNISDSSVSLPVGASVTYVINANVIAGSGSGKVIHTVTATTLGSVVDPDENDNVAVDTNNIGTIRTLTVTKTGFTSGGTVASIPANIDCGSSCTSASGTFLDGAEVMLVATPAPGSTFIGWTGACTGTGACTVTMNGSQAVTAQFAGPPSTIAVNGGDGQKTNVSTAFATPLSVVVRDADGNPVPGVVVTFTGPASGASITGGTATTNASGIASRSISANATPGAYSATASVAGIATPATFALANLGAPATITKTGGDQQSAPVSTAFASALAVVVRDSAGQGIPGVTVTFTPPASGATASLSAPSVVTDQDGAASVAATASTTAGSYLVSAKAGALTTTFSLTNAAGAPSALELVSGGGQSATVASTFTNPIQVQIRDAYGNPVSGVSVAFDVPALSASGVASPATAVTGATGIASTSVTANTVAGAWSLEARAFGLAPLLVPLANLPGPVAALGISAGGAQSATVGTPFASALGVVATDAFGNAVPGATVTFAAPAGGATASLGTTSAITDAAGSASTSATAGTIAGSYSVVASAAGASPVSFSLENLPGAPASITLAGGSGQSREVGLAFAAPLAVVVRDAHDNPVPNATVSYDAPSSGATAALSSTSATTDAAGAASVTAIAGDVAGSYSVSATLSGFAPVTFALTNLPGAPSAIEIAAGGAQSATVGEAFSEPLRVRVRDAKGNVVPNASVSFQAPSSGASAILSSTSATTDASGNASATATANLVAGSFQVKAALQNGAETSFSLTNLAGAPAFVTAAPESTPQTATVRTAFVQPLVAIVTDAYGNPAPSAVVHFSPPSAIELSSGTATTNAQGRASVDATAGTTAGAWFVTAHVDGVQSDALFSLTTIPGAPSTIVRVAGSPQTATVDTDFATPLAVRVLDADGNPVPDVDVDFLAPASGPSATFAHARVVTNANGEASTQVHANTRAGAFTATAIAPSVASPATFELTNAPGAPAAIAAGAASSPQSARVATAFGKDLVATVTDAFGNPVPGVTVTFEAPASGATAALSSPTAVTNASGVASVAITAGEIAGPYSVTASVSGVAPATYALTNLAGAASSIVVASGSAQSTTVDTDFAEPIAVLVRDEHGNPVPFASVTFEVPAGRVSVALSSTTLETDLGGKVTVTAHAGKGAGTYAVTASTDGAATPASFELTNLPAAPHAIAASPATARQSTEVSTHFAAPLEAIVTDEFGNGVPDVTVDFSAPSSGASARLSATSAVTNANGVASVGAIANDHAGTYSVHASSKGLEDAVFELTNTSGAPGAVVLLSGGGQRTKATQPWAKPVVFRVEDAKGNPVAGVEVRIELPRSGASARLASSDPLVSDAAGEVRASLVANDVVGEIAGNASASGARGASFTLHSESIATTTTAKTIASEKPIDASVEIDVAVTAEHGTPSGNVRVTTEDGLEVGRGVLASGAARIAVKLPRLGAHTLMVAYEPEGPYLASQAAPLAAFAEKDSGILAGGVSCSASPMRSSSGALGIVLAIFATIAARIRRARRRALAGAAAAAVSLGSTSASAQEAGGVSIDRFHAAAADSRWFALDTLSFSGHLTPSAMVVADYARMPLVAYESNGTRRTEIVRSSLVLHAGLSLTLWDRVRIGATVPASPFQDGEDGTYNGVAMRGGRGGLGDVALTADARVFGAPRGPIRGALGLRTTLPTGSRESYMGDGVATVAPRAMLAGSSGWFEWAGHASLVLRERTDLAATGFASEVRTGAGVGARVFRDRLLVGPEVIAAIPVAGSGNATAAEGWMGAHLRATKEIEIGLGGGVGIANAVGTPEQRGLLSIAWRPEAAPYKSAPQPAAEPVPPAPAAPAPAEEMALEDPWAEEEVATSEEAPPPEQPASPSEPEYLDGRVYFATNKATIEPQQHQNLQTILAALQMRPDAIVEVEGHADERGAESFNESLSVARARAVMTWLQEHGIPAERMVPVGFGARRPEDPTKNPDGFAKNRRVQLRVVDTTAAQR